MANTIAQLADQMAAQAATAKKNQTSGAGLSNDNKTLAENYQTFLTLLTTQLQHQDPTSPMDTNQFMQQLTQFSGIEQQLKSNDYLSKINTTMVGTATNNAVSYLERYVDAKGNESTMNSSGQVKWNLTFPRDATQATITIRDSKGTVIATEDKSFATGTQEYVWNGRNSVGVQAPQGTYSVSVEAKDQFNASIDVGTTVSGRVTEVDLSGDEPMLTVNGVKIKASGVTEIRVSS